MLLLFTAGVEGTVTRYS